MTEKLSNPSRRSTLKVLGGAIAGVSVAGCSSDSDTSTPGDGGNGQAEPGTTVGDSTSQSLAGHEVHIITSDANADARAFYDELKETFNEETGAVLNLEYTGGGTGVTQRVAQLLQVGNPPEIVMGNNWSTFGFYNEGLLRPMTGPAERIHEQWGEPPEGRRFINDNGEEHFIPMEYNASTWWYRSDIADVVPDTWENAIEYARQADESDEVDNGAWMPTSDDNSSRHPLLSWGWGHDAHVLTRNNDGEVVSVLDENKDKWIDVLNALDGVHDYSPDTRQSGNSDMTHAIQSRTAASTLYMGARPKLQSIVNDRPFARDVDLVGIPVGPNGDGPTNSSGNGLISFEGSDGEAADAFIDHFVENIFDFYVAYDPVHRATPYPDMAEDSGYIDRLEEATPDDFTRDQIERFIIHSSDVHSLLEDTTPVNPYTEAIDGDSVLQRMNRNALIGNSSPGDAVDQAHDELSELLDRVRAQN